MIANITGKDKNRWCPYYPCNKTARILCSEYDCDICYNRSLKSFNMKELIWNYEKNNTIPCLVSLGCDSKTFYFTCKECNHEVEICPYHISKGMECYICSGHRLCENNCDICFNKSFASSFRIDNFDNIKNKGINPRFLFKSSKEKYYFTCDNGHSFKSALNHISSGKWCPKCTNKTEAMIIKKLEKNNINFIYQYKIDWCKNKTYLPYDFYLPDYNIILECDGRQHFVDIKKWKSSYKLQQLKDAYKMKCANQNGINFIRIFQEYIQLTQYSYDWYELLKYSINELVNDYSYDTKNIYIGIDNCGKNMYDEYEKNVAKLMNEYSCDELCEFIENYENDDEIKEKYRDL